MQESHEYPSGPNAEEPDEAFSDGAYLYEVSVSPAMVPTRLLHGSPMTNGFGQFVLFFLLYVTVGLGALLFDRRYKVLVSRKPRRPGAGWTVVTGEFFDSGGLAKARQLELLREWEPGQFDSAWAIPAKDIRDARRSGQRVVEVRKTA